MDETRKALRAGPTMPAFFFGHGNPMNAIQHNAYTDAWAAIGRALPRPQAIVVVSANWYLPGTWVTALRDAGVLVVGSGNLVHNLHAYAWGRHAAEPFEWALRFERRARELLVA